MRPWFLMLSRFNFRYSSNFCFLIFWLNCHASPCLNFVLYNLFVIGYSDFWLDSLIQNTLENGNEASITAIREVLTKHQSLAATASLHNGIMGLCLDIFKGYQDIMGWVAERYQNVTEVWLGHNRMLTKWRSSKKIVWGSGNSWIFIALMAM